MTVIKPDMLTDRITRRDILPLSFLKKSAYTGSKRGLRYKMEKAEMKVETAETEEGTEGGSPKTVLRVYTWRGIFAFDHTPKNEIAVRDFEFSDAGIDGALDYLNEILVK